jgi:two-component system chemotaxis sensor kinase CheA
MDSRKYRDLFVAESREHLQRCTRELLAWERDPLGPEPVAALFRSVHTIKGMAASLGLGGLANLSHALEHVLSAARDGGLVATPDVIDAALRAMDFLERGVARVEEGTDPGESADALIVELAGLARPETGTWPVPAGVPAVPAPPRPAQPVDGPQLVRVSLERLDRLVTLGGELLVARTRLLRRLGPGTDAGLHGEAHRLGRLVEDLHQQVLLARMAPVAEVFERFPRTVRDLARQLGKEVRLDIEGEEIELDRALLERIPDVLLHLLRNAVDHGIEAPVVRRAAGKPAEGRIRLAARREGDAVLVDVEDDGRGIDRAAVVARAEALGLPAAGLAGGEDGLLEVLARPGFSTAARVTDVSGRGVGIDVVVQRVRRLGGSTELSSRAGAGTLVRLRLPLSVAVVPAMLVGIGPARYAVPLTFVAEAARFEPGPEGTVRHRGRELPRVDLGGTRPDAPWRPGVVLDVGGRVGALMVDTLLGREDIVVAPVDPPRGMARWVNGATILSDGVPALVVDPAALV